MGIFDSRSDSTVTTVTNEQTVGAQGAENALTISAGSNVYITDPRSVELAFQAQNRTTDFAGATFTSAVGLTERTSQRAFEFGENVFSDAQDSILANNRDSYEFAGRALDLSQNVFDSSQELIADAADRTSASEIETKSALVGLAKAQQTGFIFPLLLTGVVVIGAIIILPRVFK